jgi:hypothetical protein
MEAALREDARKLRIRLADRHRQSPRAPARPRSPMPRQAMMMSPPRVCQQPGRAGRSLLRQHRRLGEAARPVNKFRRSVAQTGVKPARTRRASRDTHAELRYLCVIRARLRSRRRRSLKPGGQGWEENHRRRGALIHMYVGERTRHDFSYVSCCQGRI